jgi:hypothetical protein
LTLNYHNKLWANNTTWNTVYVAVSLLLLLSSVLRGNACYNSFQNVLLSCVLTGSFREQIYRTFLPVLTRGCECCSLMYGTNTHWESSSHIIKRKRRWRKQHNNEIHNLKTSPNICICSRNNTVRMSNKKC